MKKLFTSIVLLFILTVSNAQKFENIKKDIFLFQFETAKNDLDKLLQKNPTLVNTPEALYWESKIYNGFFKDSSLTKKYPNSFSDMRNILEKLLNSDLGNSFLNEKATKEKELNTADPFIQVYTKIRTDGVDRYNQKNYKEAALLFNDCIKYSDVFYGRGWLDTKLKLDTISILFTAICFKNDKNFTEAIPRFERLINEKAMVRIEGVYSDLLTSLMEVKDKSKFDKYVELAKKEAPNYIDTWEQFSFAYIEKAYTLDEKVAAFDQLLATKKLKEIDAEYFGQWFIEAKQEEKSNEKYVSKASEAFQQAYTINPNNFRAAYNSGLSFYAQYGNFESQVDSANKLLKNINTEKEAKLAKARNEKIKPTPVKLQLIEAPFKSQLDSVNTAKKLLGIKLYANVDLAISWFEKSFNVLKVKENLNRNEKNLALRAIDYIAELYQLKSRKYANSNNKADLLLSDEFAKKFEEYDKLHDKYK